MRFMYIVRSAHPGPPTPELLEAMHKLANRRRPLDALDFGDEKTVPNRFADALAYRAL